MSWHVLFDIVYDALVDNYLLSLELEEIVYFLFIFEFLQFLRHFILKL